MNREHSKERTSNIRFLEVVLSWDTFLMFLIFVTIAAALLPVIISLYTEVASVTAFPHEFYYAAMAIGISLTLGMRYFKLHLRRSIENGE